MNESERLWKEAAVAYSKDASSNLSGFQALATTTVFLLRVHGVKGLLQPTKTTSRLGF
jgi:hypothetical protein